jgi:hypothetical protein
MKTQQENTVAVETVNLTGLPVDGATDAGGQAVMQLAIPTDAEKAALVEKMLAEQAAKEATALARFDTNVGFKLEGQVIGQSTKRSVNKSGAVTVGMLGKKDMAVVSGGLKGAQLDAFIRMRRDEVKDQQCQLATRIAGDANWTGDKVTMSGKGNKITLSFVKVEPIKVTLTAEPSDETIANSLGLTVEQVKAMKAAKARTVADEKAKAEKAIADEKAAKELADEEAARVAKEAQGNGEVVNQPSDNDGHAE